MTMFVTPGYAQEAAPAEGGKSSESEEPPFFAAQGATAGAKAKPAEEDAFDLGSASEDAAAKPAEVLF